MANDIGGEIHLTAYIICSFFKPKDTISMMLISNPITHRQYVLIAYNLCPGYLEYQ